VSLGGIEEVVDSIERNGKGINSEGLLQSYWKSSRNNLLEMVGARIGLARGTPATGYF